MTMTSSLTATPGITATPAVSTSAAITDTGATTSTAQATPSATIMPLPTPRATFQAKEAEATGPAPLGSQAAVTITTGDWPTFGYDYENTRHVPLSQIDKDNVSQLGRAWSVDFQSIDPSIPGGQENYPLEIGGVLYATTSFNHAFAIDAATGAVKWHFAPDQIGRFHNFGLSVNRGLAYCNNTLYMLTLDMRIFAINADDGSLAKEINIADTVPEASTDYGYYETAAPICYDGILVIGSSGGDNGVRGFVMAYNASDLTPAWPNPYWTVPPTDQDWRSRGRFHGGGAVWMPVGIDTQTETVYFSVGNPSPDFFPQLRPGNNPKTNSLIAVDLRTGNEKWWRQQLSGDQWDYDTTSAPMIYTTASTAACAASSPWATNRAIGSPTTQPPATRSMTQSRCSIQPIIRLWYRVSRLRSILPRLVVSTTRRSHSTPARITALSPPWSRRRS